LTKVKNEDLALKTFSSFKQEDSWISSTKPDWWLTRVIICGTYNYITFHSLKNIGAYLILLPYKSIGYVNALIFALASMK